MPGFRRSIRVRSVVHPWPKISPPCLGGTGKFLERAGPRVFFVFRGFSYLFETDGNHEERFSSKVVVPRTSSSLARTCPRESNSEKRVDCAALFDFIRTNRGVTMKKREELTTWQCRVS